MNEFSYKMARIKGFICPSKTSLQINDQSFICNNDNQAKIFVKYVATLDDSLIKDNRVKKLIRKAVKADEH